MTYREAKKGSGSPVLAVFELKSNDSTSLLLTRVHDIYWSYLEETLHSARPDLSHVACYQ